MKFSFPFFVIFLGSFLLFAIQPMVGKTLLPAFGGTSSTWVICLCAYQVLLLAGYFYAHGISCAPISRKRQAYLHSVLLGCAGIWVACMCVMYRTVVEKTEILNIPSLEVLASVIILIGGPYVLLAANSSFVQALASARHGRDVFKLYAVSNLGSFAGLLVYPFFVEPYIPLLLQWSGFALLLLLYLVFLMLMTRQINETAATEEPAIEKCATGVENVVEYNRAMQWTWFVLPAVTCFLLNAITTHLSMDITPVPLLWVVLLALYLLSYTIGFSTIGEKYNQGFGLLTLVPLCACMVSAWYEGSQAFFANLIAGVTLLLLGCSCVHGWLYQLRPQQHDLTRYYLMTALGGAAGGLLSGLAMPWMFDFVAEYPLGLSALAVLIAYRLGVQTPNLSQEKKQWFAGAQKIAWIVALFCMVQGVRYPSDVILRVRSFYGCLTVKKIEAKNNFGDSITGHALQYGATTHGLQYRVHYLQNKPTTYYGETGGGLALKLHPAYTSSVPMTVGLVGLGVGTMACYGRTNDWYRFYEINPQVIAIAQNTNLFTYLADSAAKVEIIQGDARKKLESERVRYDVLVIDAYSGDAIPYHLATREAFHLYRDRLKLGGILGLHISNWHIDLAPLCKAAGRELGWNVLGTVSPQNNLCSSSTWVFFSESALKLGEENVREIDWEKTRNIPLPEDACGSLLGLIRFFTWPDMREPNIHIDLNALGRGRIE